MRVLYFSRGYTPHDHRFLSGLSQTRHEVFYVKLEGDVRQTEDRPVPSQIEQVLWAGGQRSFRWRDIPRFASDLRGVIERVKPDIIHAGPIQTCAFLAVLTGFRPILTMSWGFDLMQDAGRNAWWSWVTRYTLQRSTFFTSDAKITRDKAIAYDMDPDRTIVFPWGVDLKHYRPRRSNGRRRSFVVFCNRAWEKRYGVDVLAKAFATAARQRKDISLLLLGGGSQAQVIRQIFMSAGVLDHVQYGGHIPQKDLPRWYNMADLYVSPSHIDGSSVSLMEALACGLPCLVSDIPANREWVTEGVNGWLFPDGDADALASKMLAVMAQRRKLPEIGRAARKSARERADWNKNFAKLLEAYEQTVQLYRRSK